MSRPIRRRRPLLTPLLAIGLLVSGARALGQAPTLPSDAPIEPGSGASTLGRTPGARVNPLGSTSGTQSEYLGGPAGTSAPRVPTAITAPPGAAAAPPSITAPTRLTITDVPLYGPLEIPEGAEAEGPPDGLTLDAAIERLLVGNLALQARRWQIPQARADVLTARLRANPVFYADSQLVPYGRYDDDHPGGPTQYDINITHPIDYSFQRRARTVVAERNVAVVEAQFQDAVRIEVDNLYTAFVNALAARETVRFARASVIGLGKVLAANEELYRKASVTRPDLVRVRALRGAAELGVMRSEETYRQTLRTLAGLLNLPPSGAEALAIRGTIGDTAPPPPGSEALARLALESRPDLLAARLGVGRAEADIDLANANRFGNAYLLYQPYSFQNLAPSGRKSARSWAIGITAPIPLSNRNQGGVARARIGLEKTQIELAALEHRVLAEVRTAEREYDVTKRMLARYDADLLPEARLQREDTFRLFISGELTSLDYYNAERNYNEVVRRYRDTLVRHRRSMLALNTAVGARLLP